MAFNMAGERHGNGMVRVKWPLTWQVNGMGTAWERHGSVNQLLWNRQTQPLVSNSCAIVQRKVLQYINPAVVP
jgi:hypothetical protein